jgi:uncharacterized protein HemX
MVVQKALNNLKENGTKDDKVAVASGIAISVVLVLFAGWAIYFFHRIQSGAQQTSLTGGIQDQFNFDSVNQAQQDLQQQLGSSLQDLQDIRQQSAGGNAQMQTAPMQTDGSVNTGQFGTPAQ